MLELGSRHIKLLQIGIYHLDSRQLAVTYRCKNFGSRQLKLHLPTYKLGSHQWRRETLTEIRVGQQAVETTADICELTSRQLEVRYRCKNLGSRQLKLHLPPYKLGSHQWRRETLTEIRIGQQAVETTADICELTSRQLEVRYRCKNLGSRQLK